MQEEAAAAMDDLRQTFLERKKRRRQSLELPAVSAVLPLRVLRRRTKLAPTQTEGAELLEAVHAIIRAKPFLKENPKQLIARKRELLLMQLQIDQKREQIKQFEERIGQKNARLRDIEAEIFGDMQAFERFQQENLHALKIGIGDAEQERKARVAVFQEFKALTEIKAVRLGECKRAGERFRELCDYRRFLAPLLSGESEPDIHTHPRGTELSFDALKRLLEDVRVGELRLDDATLPGRIFKQVEQDNLRLMQENQTIELLLEEKEGQLRASQCAFDAKKALLEQQNVTLSMRIAQQSSEFASFSARDIREMEGVVAALSMAVGEAAAAAGLSPDGEDEDKLLALQEMFRIQRSFFTSIDPPKLKSFAKHLAEENKKRAVLDTLAADERRRQDKARRLRSPAHLRVAIRRDVFRSQKPRVNAFGGVARAVIAESKVDPHFQD